MQDRKTMEIVKKAGRLRRYDDSELSSLQKYITILSKYSSKNFPDLKAREIRFAVLEKMDQINNTYVQIANFSGIFYQLLAARQLKDDPEFIEKNCANIDLSKIEEPNYYYDSNYKGNKYGALMELAYAIKEIEKKGEINYRSNSGKKLTLADKIKLLTDKYISVVEDDTKEKVIENLKFITDTLDEFGLLKDYQNRYKEKMEALGVSKIATESQDVLEFFSEENLKKIDVDTLIMLNLFYENRLAKEISALGEAYFSIDTLYLWKRVKEKKPISISGKELNALKNKAKCVDELTVRMFEFVSGKKKDLTEEENEQGFTKTDISENRKYIVNQESDNFRKIFDSFIPQSDNNLEKDLQSYQVMINVRENCYKIRESFLVGLLYHLNKSKSSKNFGVIRKEIINGRSVDTLDKDYILIGIDYEGLNMPIRLHTNKDTLIDVLRRQQGNAILPEYEGGEDFVIDGRNISTDLLLPLTKKQKKEINEAYKISEGTKIQKFISHLRFLKDKGDTKFPKHLMIKRKVGNKEVLQRDKKKYIDLKTKKRYYLEGTKFISVDDCVRL